MQMCSVRLTSRSKTVLDIFKEILLKAGNFRGIRDFVKPTEFLELAGIEKENEEQEIGRNGKNTLDNERP